MALRRTRRLVRPLAVTAVAVVVLYLLAAALPRMRGASLLEQLFQLVALWYLVPGAVVVLRRDGHVIGWLLLVNGLFWSVLLSSEVPAGGLSWLPPDWLAWLGYWIGYAGWTSTVALFVLFPDGLVGRSSRQRRAARAIIATALGATVAGMFAAQVGDGSAQGLRVNPTGLGFLPVTVADYLIVPIGVVAIGSVVGLWRRARAVTGVRRRQYTWVLFAFSVVVAGLAVGLALGELIGESAWLLIVVGWFLVPSAFSVAILRHHLYDIDRIVSRTVTYAVITAVVAGIYAVPVVALPSLFGVRGPLLVAAATLAAAAAFSPVRRVVQRWVDRRFNRARFDAREEVDAFAASLRSQVDLDTLVADINALIDRTLQPATAMTWIRPPVSPPPDSSSGAEGMRSTRGASRSPSHDG